MTKLVFLLLIFFITAPASSVATEGESEFQAIKGLMLYCIPPIVKRINPAQFAEEKNLPEFPSDKARLFTKEGRVFAVPNQMGNAVFIMPSVGGCIVSIRRIDNDKSFWWIIDKWFGPETPFKKVSEKIEENGNSITRHYEADMSGKVSVLVSARKIPKETGMQAVITVARIKD